VLILVQVLQTDIFVEYMLDHRHAEASGGKKKAAIKDATRWLALYNNCRKLLKCPRTQTVMNDDARAFRTTCCPC
jgi:hypothetical protein